MKDFVQLAVALGILFSIAPHGSTQGFVNLNFERAQFLLPPTPPGQYGTVVDPSLAFGRWTITNAMGPGYYPVFPLYNNLTIGSSGVVLVGPQFPNALNIAPLQGSYSVMLQGFQNTNFVGLPAMFQSGTIPAAARSISILTSSSAFYTAGRVTLDGVDVPLFPVADNRIVGDVSGFAGRTAELMISTVPGNGWFYFDDIQFSPVSVPEPSHYALVTFAFIAFVFFGKRTFRE